MRARVALADSSILSATVPTEADAVVLVDIVYVLFGLPLGFHSLLCGYARSAGEVARC